MSISFWTGQRGTVAASLSESVAQADWFGSKVGSRQVLVFSSYEQAELSQWHLHDNSSINIVVPYHYRNHYHYYYYCKNYSSDCYK